MAAYSKDNIHVNGLLSGASCTCDRDSDDDGLDDLLLEASQQYEHYKVCFQVFSNTENSNLIIIHQNKPVISSFIT